MTDRQTDRQTDARGKTICLPTLSGGDIINSNLYTEIKVIRGRLISLLLVQKVKYDQLKSMII